MDVKKVVGYVLSLVGLIGLAASVFDPIYERLFGTLSPGLADGLGISLLVISLILLGAGVVVLFISGKSSSGQKKKEVPIYRGKEIVGYRRE
tara:strand:- start:1158 stop:1433 length:276 start_codon:yes stop_codon:yes gene_type:complete